MGSVLAGYGEGSLVGRPVWILPLLNKGFPILGNEGFKLGNLIASVLALLGGRSF